MHAPAGSVDMDNDGMVHHAIDHGGRDHRIAQVISQGFEVDVGGQDGGVFAVPPLNNFEKQGGVSA